MHTRTALSLLVPLCSSLVFALGQGCSSSDGTSSGNTGGMGGGDAGADTGGSTTGGSTTGGSATGGAEMGGVGGMGGTDVGCRAEEWADPSTGECHVCPGSMGGAPNELTCEDFLYENSDTRWDPETQTLVYEQQAGTPYLASASVSFDYCVDGGDCIGVSSPMAIDGYTLQATFDQIAAPLSYPWELTLSGEDACGNEVEVTNFWFYQTAEEDEYAYFCE